MNAMVVATGLASAHPSGHCVSHRALHCAVLVPMALSALAHCVCGDVLHMSVLSASQLTSYACLGMRVLWCQPAELPTR